MPSAAITTSPSATAPLANDTRAMSPWLLKGDAAMAGVHHVRGQPLGQHGDEIGAVHAECRVPARRVRHLDRRDRGPVLAEVPGIRPNPGTPFLHGRTQPDPLQLADAVRGQEHPGADFAKGWGPCS